MLDHTESFKILLDYYPGQETVAHAEVQVDLPVHTRMQLFRFFF